MAPHDRPSPPASTSADEVKGDPWHAFGYLVSGVLFYGFVGWLLDRWLETRFLVVIGIMIGAGLGIYLTFGRFGGLSGSDPAPGPVKVDEIKAQDEQEKSGEASEL